MARKLTSRVRGGRDPGLHPPAAGKKDLIDRDFARPLDVPALAREAHASTAHFSRSFKRTFGETLRRRIERAKEFLRETGLSVTDVCFQVGFRSLGSFGTAFGELVGEPPSVDRRSLGSARDLG
jgi:AraC-like DNA-binding protein